MSTRTVLIKPIQTKWYLFLEHSNRYWIAQFTCITHVVKCNTNCFLDTPKHFCAVLCCVCDLDRHIL